MKNPDGITPRLSETCTKLDIGLQDYSNMNAGILQINEHNSDTKNSEVREGYQNNLKKHWLHSRTEFSTSKISAKNDWLPKGTLVSILGKWTGRVLTTKTDKQLGRWSCVNLQGKEDQVISIYSAYRVPQDTLPGPFTTYTQQYQLLQDNEETDLCPRRKFIIYLIKEIKTK